MEVDKNKTKRLAKNTFILYIRMFLLMAVNLYTSRVIIQALGVEDFGVYNVVGGFVSMFAILSKSLSGACSRFLNFEMGCGNLQRLKKVFSISVTIQMVMALIVAVLCEIVGLWALNNYLVIPSERIVAANWVMQFSILTFCSNLITVPYNAAIIAHERMKAFAYVSLFEGIAKLIISFAVMASPIDTLIYYAMLICALQFAVRAMYRIYCRRNFEECEYHFYYEKKIMKEMFGYAGWSFIGSGAAVLRNQGNNIVLNLFFGPVVNAARGVANQVLHSVDGFVTNFMMALKPQITQSYASGNNDYVIKLIYQGARLSFYLLFFLSLPIIVNADYILGLWLKKVPDHSSLFVQLTLIYTLVESFSQPLMSAQSATGRIRNYQLIVGGVQLLNVPLGVLCLYMGCIPESIMIVAIVLSIFCLWIRLYILHRYIPISVLDFLTKVVLRAACVVLLSSIPSYLLANYLIHSFITFLVVIVVTSILSFLSIFYVGCEKNDRKKIMSLISRFIKRKYVKS